MLIKEYLKKKFGDNGYILFKSKNRKYQSLIKFNLKTIDEKKQTFIIEILWSNEYTIGKHEMTFFEDMNKGEAINEFFISKYKYNISFPTKKEITLMMLQ